MNRTLLLAGFYGWVFVILAFYLRNFSQVWSVIEGKIPFL